VWVLGALPGWRRFERARLHRRQHKWAERSDAAALQTFVERVRHRDRRLARLATAVRGGEREWRTALEAGALGDSILLPKLALEYTLLPSARPSARVASTLSVRGAFGGGGGGGGGGGSGGGHAASVSSHAPVRIQLRIDDGCSTVRWAAKQRLRTALASILPVETQSAQFLAHVWHPTPSDLREAEAVAAQGHGASAAGLVERVRNDDDNYDGVSSSIVSGGASRMAWEEVAAPWALIVRLTIAQSGMATICARGFRAERPAARAAMLALWEEVTQRARRVALELDVWQVRLRTRRPTACPPSAAPCLPLSSSTLPSFLPFFPALPSHALASHPPTHIPVSPATCLAAPPHACFPWCASRSPGTRAR